MTSESSCLPMYTVDSFTNVPFSGNPAAVCLDTTQQGLSPKVMLQITAEMNLSDTAFVRPLSKEGTFDKGSSFGLRWFTPTTEVPLCGHATLASAAVLFNCVGNASEKLCFETMKSGMLYATKRGKQIGMELPLNTPGPVDQAEIQELLELVAGPLTPSLVDVLLSPVEECLLVRLPDSVTRQEFEQLKIDAGKMTQVKLPQSIVGVIVTLKGGKENGCVDSAGVPYDFVSRFFAPWAGVPEDPVTGAAHTVLSGYWSKQLGKDDLYARQCSVRGGDLWLKVNHETSRLDVTGDATVIMEGKLRM